MEKEARMMHRSGFHESARIRVPGVARIRVSGG
jgi:hypothetical protein